jgi:hypothetical protein
MGEGGVILVSDKQARLKPCLRCGYSLRYVAGFKNCPECGLAVRVSLSGNSALDWSNPRWQRFLALGFGLLAFGMMCRLLSFTADWVLHWFEQDYSSSDGMLRALDGTVRYTSQAEPIICGIALCLLAKGERRYPDESRSVRAATLSGGLLLIATGLLNAATRHALWRPGSWGWYLLWHAMYGPWIPLIISGLCWLYAHHFGIRGGVRLLFQLARVPIWIVTAGGILWVINVDGLFAPIPLRQLLLEVAFPLATIVVSAIAIRVLLLGANEAELNWVTDP